MQNRFETYRPTADILAEARQMRDEAAARMIVRAWQGLGRAAAKLAHAVHLPQHGQPRTH